MSSKDSRASTQLPISGSYGLLSELILLLGLEFLIASDILKTVLEPTLNELAILGGIVVLRTILSVFLNREIKDLEAEGEKEQ